MTETLRDEVRRHYARAALAVLEPAGCCSAEATPTPGDPVFGPGLYDPEQLDPLPTDAVAASLGCGNPYRAGRPPAGRGRARSRAPAAASTSFSRPSASGPTGIAYGLDMTDEMLELARRNAAAAGATNARFLRGEIEAVPLPDGSVDVVISNCVINLSTDKPRVFAEIARVLRPGGRMSVSDVVADDVLSAADRAARGDYAGCIAGALSFSEYAAGLAAAGLAGIEIRPTHAAVPGMYNALVRAVRPPTREGADTADAAARAAAAGLAAARALPTGGTVTLGDACCGTDGGSSCCG